MFELDIEHFKLKVGDVIIVHDSEYNATYCPASLVLHIEKEYCDTIASIGVSLYTYTVLTSDARVSTIKLYDDDDYSFRILR